MKEYYKVMSKKNQGNWKLKKKSMKPKMVLWKIKDTDKFLTSFTKKKNANYPHQERNKGCHYRFHRHKDNKGILWKLYTQIQ